MSDHPSNPDQLMAQALGVCWHPPTSDRWPCRCGNVHDSGEVCTRLLGHDGQHHGGGDGLGWDDAPLADWEIEYARIEYARRQDGGCDRNPVECNQEAALGEAEEKLRRVRNLVAELEARADSALYNSRNLSEGESYALTEYGAHSGLADAAGLLRAALGMTR